MRPNTLWLTDFIRGLIQPEKEFSWTTGCIEVKMETRHNFLKLKTTHTHIETYIYIHIYGFLWQVTRWVLICVWLLWTRIPCDLWAVVLTWHCWTKSLPSHPEERDLWTSAVHHAVLHLCSIFLIFCKALHVCTFNLYNRCSVSNLQLKWFFDNWLFQSYLKLNAKHSLQFSENDWQLPQ